MNNLNDLEIRQSLIQYLRRKDISENEIIQELHVYNGRAIADVVTIKNEPHCYEIKGDNDKLERLLKQNEYYKQTFRKITLITTEKFLGKAQEITPDYWGILVIKYNGAGQLVIRHIRASKVNPNYNKSAALLTLWKSEILELVPDLDKKMAKSSRAVLADLIADTKEAIQVSKDIGKLLSYRFNSI